MCLRAQSWQVAESGHAPQQPDPRDCRLNPQVTLPPETQGRALGQRPIRRVTEAVMQGSGDARSDSTSSAASPLFRGVRPWRVHEEKAPALHLVGGSEALMAKRLAYLTGLPARPRLRTLEGQRGAGWQLRSCQPPNKPFSSWEQRREVSRCPGQSRHTPPPPGGVRTAR